MTLQALLTILPVGALIAAAGLKSGYRARPWPASSSLACHPQTPAPPWRRAGTVALQLLRALPFMGGEHDS